MNKIILSSDMLRNHRLDIESFTEYKDRLALVNRYLRVKLKKGNMINNATVNGVYRRGR